MPAFAPVTIHETQWPGPLAAQLRQSLLSRRLNPKFHYDSPRQVRQWLRLHEAYSPARRAVEFEAVYAPAFDSLLRQLGGAAVHLIGLGCGGGQKEVTLLERLKGAGRSVVFTATDVSPGMVVTALQGAWKLVESSRCSGLVCDLAEAIDLDVFFDRWTPPAGRRVVTFFGMIPNFEPDVMRAVLRRILRPGDLLLCSANLAPGADYRRGVERVLPQYDNALTREWLGMLLDDLEVPRAAGALTFHLEEAPAGSGFLRITATLEFCRPATARVDGETVEFGDGDRLQLFFSYRHTVSTLERLWAAASLRLLDSWLTGTGEEGVFLVCPEEDAPSAGRLTGG